MAHPCPKRNLQLKLIENQSRRITTYRRRKEGLKKKTAELSTLCGVPALLICVSPAGEIDTWPSDDGDARDITARFRSLSPEARNKHRTDLADLLRARIGTQESELDKLNNEQLQLLDSEIKSVRDRIQFLESRIPFESMANTTMLYDPTYVTVDAFSGHNHEAMFYDTTRVTMDGFPGYNCGAPTGSGLLPMNADPVSFSTAENLSELHDNYHRMGNGEGRSECYSNFLFQTKP